MTLPQPITLEDRARLMHNLEVLNRDAGGTGFICMYLTSSAQVFTAIAAEGELRGWALMPAASADLAERLAALARAMIEEGLRLVAEDSELAARAALAHAARPG